MDVVEKVGNIRRGDIIQDRMRYREIVMAVKTLIE